MVTRTSLLRKWIPVLLVVAASALYALSIEVKEDALDLLPDGIVTSDLELIRQLGMINRVYISLKVEKAGKDISDEEWQRLRRSTLATGAQLEKSPLLTEVVYRMPPGFERSLFKELWPLLPVVADGSDYRVFEEAVTEEGVRRRLKTAFQLLNSPAGIGLQERVVNDPLGLSLLIFAKLKQLRGEFAVTMKDGVFTSADRTSCLIWADSQKPLTDSQHALAVEKVINEALASSLQEGVHAEVIGTLPHTLANIRTVKSDLRLLLPLATFLLVAFLLYAFRDFRGILVVAIPFLAAAPAIVLQNLICGKVSGLALGFGIVLTGLAVDFAIHIYMALRREEGDRRTILANLKRPILLAWCTTTSVFVILLLSSVPSHRQMAVLAIAGISLAVLFSWLLVPTIVGRKKHPPLAEETVARPQAGKDRLALILWILLLLGGAACWPWLEFNGDMRVLDATNQQLRNADKKFHATWRGSADQALLISRGPTLDEALAVNDQVFAFLSREGLPFQSVAPILPGPETREERLDRWYTFWEEHREATVDRLRREGQNLGFRQGSFQPFFRFIAEPVPEFDGERVVNGPLSPLLASMVIFREDAGRKDKVLVMAIVPENDSTWPVLQELNSMDIEGLSIISFRTWREQVEQLLRHDIITLSLLAAMVVVTLVTLFFRQFRPAAAALAPVASALAAMSLFSFVTGQDINIMHILMGIMVIGLCVDYGIFSVCALVSGTSRTTRRAVSICAVSSCIGFGVLAFADHPALYSLGTTVLVGLGAAWPTAIRVTPALLKKEDGVA